MKLPTIIFFVTLCAVSCRLALAAEPPPKSPPAPPSDTIAARRSVEISGISNLYVGDLVLKAAAEHAGIANVQRNDVANRVGVRSGRGSAMSGRRIGPGVPEVLEIVVDLRGADAAAAGVKPRAVEYLDAIVASLERRLQEFHAARTDAAKRNLHEVERRQQDSDAEASDLEQKIRAVTGRVDASIDPIRAAVPKLEEERQSLKLQVIGKQARQQALAEAIERFAKVAEERAKSDPVADELKKIVEARAIRLNNVMRLREAAAAAEADVNTAQADVAEATARLLERRETVKQSAGGGDVLAALNRELAMLSIDVAEAEAKLSAIEKLLGQYGDAQPLLADAERLRRERERLDKSRDRAEAELRDAQATMPDPVLRVLDSDATPATPPASPPKQ